MILKYLTIISLLIFKNSTAQINKSSLKQDSLIQILAFQTCSKILKLNKTQINIKNYKQKLHGIYDSVILSNDSLIKAYFFPNPKKDLLVAMLKEKINANLQVTCKGYHLLVSEMLLKEAIEAGRTKTYD